MCRGAGLPASWNPRGLGGGGGMFAPSISPHDSNVLFLAIDMSELFRSLDGGQSWQILPFTQVQVKQLSEVQFTSTPGTLYLAENRRLPNEANTTRPIKSIDLGDSWSPFANWPPQAGLQAVALFANPNRDDTFIVCTGSRLYFYQSGSTNGGFSLAYSFTNANGRVGGVFWDANLAYAGTSEGLLVSSNGGASFANSVSPPAGHRIISFAGAKDPANGQLRFYCVSSTLSVGAQSTPQTFANGTANRVYRLDWPQDSAWTLEWTGLPSNDHPILVAMARNNIGIAHVAVARVNSYPTNCTAYRQAGPGTSWTRTFIVETNGNIATGWGSFSSKSVNPANSIETDITYAYPCGLAVAPDDANFVVLSDNAMIHKTTNGVAPSPVWQQIYTANDNPGHGAGQLFPHGQSYQTTGLEITLTYWLDWVSTNEMWIGAADYQAPHSTDGGKRWGFDYDHQTLGAGDVYQVTHDPTSGVRYAISTYLNSSYEFLGQDDVHVDNTGPPNKMAPGLFALAPGATVWTVLRTNFGVSSGRGANPVWLTVDAPRRRLFVAIPNSDTNMAGIYRLDLVSQVWTNLGVPWRGGLPLVHPFNIRVLRNGDLLVSFSARQVGDNNAPYAPTSGVMLYQFADMTWTDRTRAEMQYFTRDVMVDPTDPTEQTWFACVSNTDNTNTSPSSADLPMTYGGLYVTTNAGDNWTRLWSGTTQACASVTSCTPHPTLRGELWMSTRFSGLWLVTNVFATSGPVFVQTSYPFRAPERVFFNPYNPDELWVTSNGYGVSATTRPTAFAEWQLQKFSGQASNTNIAGWQADPDMDSRSNLMEYFLGQDPTAANPPVWPMTAWWTNASQPYLSLVFQRRRAAADVSFTVETSADCATWTNNATLLGTAQDNGDGTETLTYLDAVPASAPARFIRVRASQP